MWSIGMSYSALHGEKGATRDVIYLSEYSGLGRVTLGLARYFFLQADKDNTAKMINDIRDAVDGVDPSRDTFAYSDK